MRKKNYNAVTNTPQNTNYLTQLRYKLFVKKAPHVNFFTQDIIIPGLSVSPTHQPNPLVNIPYWGDHPTYDPLRVTFILDAEMKSYFELHHWLRGLSFPESYEEYRRLEGVPLITGDGLFSDIAVHVLSSTEVPKFAFIFRDAFPVSLGGMKFSSTNSDVTYITIEAVFKYTLFNIEFTNSAWG